MGTDCPSYLISFYDGRLKGAQVDLLFWLHVLNFKWMSLCILGLNNACCCGSMLFDDSDGMAHELTWLVFIPVVVVYKGSLHLSMAELY